MKETFSHWISSFFKDVFSEKKLFHPRSRLFWRGLIPILLAYSIGFADFFIPFFKKHVSEAPVVVIPPEIEKAPEIPDIGPWDETLEMGEGDTLMGILTKLHISTIQSHEAVTALRPLFDPRDLKVGQEISIQYAKSPSSGKNLENTYDLLEISLRPDVGYAFRVIRQKDGSFKAIKEKKELAYQDVIVQGSISVSLYRDALKEGADPQVLHEMIRAFSYDVNFQLDFQPGDKFSLFYREAVDEETGMSRPEKLFFATLTLSGKVYKIYRFSSPKGSAQFYTESGASVHKDLLKTPVDGARLSSRFGKRRHPILGYTKFHKGVDFAAPTGTPVMAAGNGTVEKAFFNKAYGNYVLVRHENSGYKTAYAHLSRYARGTRPGRKVKQGDIIGYIGSTGRTTGPHLHFELIKGGKQINPQLVKLMPGSSLSGKELKAFRSFVAQVNQDFNVTLTKGDED